MKIKRIIAVTLSALLAVLTLTSCKQTPAEPTDPVSGTETTSSANDAAATEKPDASSTDAASLAGTYICERCTATVTATEDGGLAFRFFWGSGAREYAQWTMSGAYDPADRSVSFTDCEKSIGEFGPDDVEVVEVEYSDGEGKIQFTDDGMIWEDAKEGIADGMIFILSPEE